MERDVMVHVREPCGACKGSGVRRVAAGTGHVQWTRRAACEQCEGAGHLTRWITLDELRGLLER